MVGVQTGEMTALKSQFYAIKFYQNLPTDQTAV